MKIRLATMEDLKPVKEMYQQIVHYMNEQKISIWDDVYPCEFLEEDIKNNQLYLLVKEESIVSAFALCKTNTGEDAVKWEDGKAKVVYIDRFAVCVTHLKRGIGSITLEKAKEIAKTMGAKYLRLFVVDINIPAISLYEKQGFAKAKGIYFEKIDEDLTLQEYGYEIKL